MSVINKHPSTLRLIRSRLVHVISRKAQLSWRERSWEITKLRREELEEELDLDLQVKGPKIK